jgi:hypothetical protein
MRVLKVLVAIPLWFLLVGVASPTPTPASSPSAEATATPAPTPIPTNANIALDVAAGGPNTQITVSGNSFLPGEQMSIYWDTPTKVIGSAKADGGGNFANVHVKPFAGDRPGPHRICASVNPYPCARFELQGSPTPTPAQAPSPADSPSPSPTASAVSSARLTPLDTSPPNNLDVLLKPPFIFLPVIAALGILAALVYWLLSVIPRPQRRLANASIVHRSLRPDYRPPADDNIPPQPPWPAPPPYNPEPEPPPQPPELTEPGQ